MIAANTCGRFAEICHEGETNKPESRRAIGESHGLRNDLKGIDAQVLRIWRNERKA